MTKKPYEPNDWQKVNGMFPEMHKRCVFSELCNLPRLTILSFCCESCENGSGVVCKELFFSVEMLWHAFFGALVVWVITITSGHVILAKIAEPNGSVGLAYSFAVAIKIN